MKVIVNEDACIRCGACGSVCPAVFDVDSGDAAKVKVPEIPEDQKDAVNEAAEGCPVLAISVEE